MAKLLLMRHAKSSWDDESLSDFNRPLNDRGRDAAPRIADYLAEERIVPDLIISSSSVRTHQTASLMLQRWSKEVQCRWLDRLYLAPPVTITRAIVEFWSDGVLMVLGHNPGLEVLCESLTEQVLHMPTAGVWAFEWKNSGRPQNEEEIVAANFTSLFHVVPKSLIHD